MQELKSKVMDVIHEINEAWVDALKESYQKSQRVSSTEMMGRYSDKLKKLDEAFRDADSRISKRSGKKGFWGR